MRLLVKIFLFLSMLTGMFAQTLEFAGELVEPPVATMQLGPSIFLSEDVLNALQVTDGYPVKVIHKDKELELRAYKFFESNDKFAIHKQYAAKLELSEGENTITLFKLDPEKSLLEPQPIGFRVENYPGDLSTWNGFAIGAPHGDCDNETGVIAKLLTTKYGIPSTAAYGCRLSYRGIWYDCNRPLMKEPNEDNRGVQPERQWNADAEEKYFEYLSAVRKNSNLIDGERFKLFCSFHGHDLTVKLPAGEVIERPVIEAAGVGFTNNELRRIKEFYNRSKLTYYEKPPDLYFGNLPEDQTYYVEGIPLQFFYSGLGVRTYGTLQSDLVENAIHIETPNTMRLDEKVQTITAKFLFDLFSFVKDSVLPQRNNLQENYSVIKPDNYNTKALVPSGSFIMGTQDLRGWASEKPQHEVYLDEFEIDVHEVTNEQYVNFLNEALKNELVKYEDGVVTNSLNPDQIICITKEKKPLSEIIFNNGSFNVNNDRKYFPVIYVTWHGANLFANYYGERLPTEAEWEKAASWDGTKKYFYSIQSDTISGSNANFEDSGDPFEFNFTPATTPVGYYSNNSSYGVYDMSGNVWEWCADNYQYDYYFVNNGIEWKNPEGPEKSTMKSLRGGAWNTEFSVTRNTMRLGVNPNEALINTGFRCVKTSANNHINRKGI